MGWARVFAALGVGVLLVVGGARLVFGPCESLNVAGQRGNRLECAEAGEGSIAANPAGLTFIVVGLVVLAIAGSVIVLEFRSGRDRSERSRRRSREPSRHRR